MSDQHSVACQAVRFRAAASHMTTLFRDDSNSVKEGQKATGLNPASLSPSASANQENDVNVKPSGMSHWQIPRSLIEEPADATPSNHEPITFLLGMHAIGSSVSQTVLHGTLRNPTVRVDIRLVGADSSISPRTAFVAVCRLPLAFNCCTLLRVSLVLGAIVFDPAHLTARSSICGSSVRRWRASTIWRQQRYGCGCL